SAVRREELGGERWICPPPGRVCHEWLVRTLRADGHEPDIVHQADEKPTLAALVTAGHSIALIPPLVRGPPPAEGVVEPLVPLPVRPVALGCGAAAGDRGDGAGAAGALAAGVGAHAPLNARGPPVPDSGHSSRLGNLRPAPSVPWARCRGSLAWHGVGPRCRRRSLPHPLRRAAAGSTPSSARPLRLRRWRRLVGYCALP